MLYKIIVAESLPQLEAETQKLINKQWRTHNQIQVFNETPNLTKFYREMIYESKAIEPNLIAEKISIFGDHFLQWLDDNKKLFSRQNKKHACNCENQAVNEQKNTKMHY